jgi:hypothetical protein
MKIPLPPKTVLTLTKLWPHARRQGHEIGHVYRVGYYCKKDGLDTIWLVDAEGNYDWTVDHDFVAKFFTVTKLSTERSLYGVNKIELGPLPL